MEVCCIKDNQFLHLDSDKEILRMKPRLSWVEQEGPGLLGAEPETQRAKNEQQTFFLVNQRTLLYYYDQPFSQQQAFWSSTQVSGSAWTAASQSVLSFIILPWAPTTVQSSFLPIS